MIMGPEPMMSTDFIEGSLGMSRLKLCKGRYSKRSCFKGIIFCGQLPKNFARPVLKTHPMPTKLQARENSRGPYRGGHQRRKRHLHLQGCGRTLGGSPHRGCGLPGGLA